MVVTYNFGSVYVSVTSFNKHSNLRNLVNHLSETASFALCSLYPRFFKKASGILQSPPSVRHAISS